MHQLVKRKLLITILILFVLLVTAITLLFQKRNLITKIPLVGNIYGTACKASLPLANELISSKTIYQIPSSESELFIQKLSRVVSGEILIGYRRLLKQVRTYSPEAYFIFVKHNWRQPEVLGKTLNAWWFGETIETATIVTHEYLHSARYPCFYQNESCYLSTNDVGALNGDYQSYGLTFDDRRIRTQTSLWLDNKSYSFDLNKSKLFPSREVKIIPVTGTSFDSRIDQIYLSSSDGDLETLLSEINSYIRSTRIARAMECSGVASGKADSLFYTSALSRIMYLTSLYISYAKESQPRTWEYLSSNREFTYLLRWSIVNGIDEARHTIKEYTRGKTTTIIDTDTPEEVNANISLIEKAKVLQELYEIAGVTELPLSFQDEKAMQDNNLNFRIYQY